jgi:branched-chain amino acid transport system permease protein
MRAKWGRLVQFDPPEWLFGATPCPSSAYPTYRVSTWCRDRDRTRAVVFLIKTRVGMMIRAGVDDRAILSACNVQGCSPSPLPSVRAGGFAGAVGGTAVHRFRRG